MAPMPDFKLNMAELVAISNQVNETVCRPIAERVLSAAKADAATFRKTGDYEQKLGIQTDPRAGVDDWAHTYVVADSDHAGAVEARHGTLARALGSV